MLAVDLALTDGKAVRGDLVRESFEDNLPPTVEVEGALYEVTVLGMGINPERLAESMQLRKQHRR